MNKSKVQVCPIYRTGHTSAKKVTHCFSAVDILLGILHFRLLDPAISNEVVGWDSKRTCFPSRPLR